MGKREPGVIRKCISGKCWKKLERREKMHPPLNWNLSSHCLPMLTACPNYLRKAATTENGHTSTWDDSRQKPGETNLRRGGSSAWIWGSRSCVPREAMIAPPPPMKTLVESIHSGSFTKARTIKTAPTSHCHMGKATNFPSWGHLQCVHPLTHPNGAWAI